MLCDNNELTFLRKSPQWIMGEIYVKLKKTSTYPQPDTLYIFISILSLFSQSFLSLPLFLPPSLPSSLRLLTGLATAGDASDSLMSKMTERVSGVNSSLLSLTLKLDSHSHDVKQQLKTVEGSVGDLQERMTAFESHPPTIGEVRCVQ